MAGVVGVRSPGLLLPDGSTHNLHEKDVVIVNDPKERVTFIRMHEIAFKNGISLVCQKCDGAITGSNNGSSTVLAVSCQCREWRFVA